MIPLIEDPKGLDKAIQDIQVELKAKLAWLDNAYGRASRNHKDQEGRQVYYPEVFKNTGMDYKNVMPDDNLSKSQVFFKVEDPAEIEGYQQYQANSFTYRVSLIFWFNLAAINPAAKHRFTEDLKTEVLNVLATSIAASGYQVTKIYETVQQIWKDYTILNMESRQFRHPYGGFRIEGNLTFTDLCRN